VAASVPHAVVSQGCGLVAVEGIDDVGEGVDAVREDERGWPPVGRILIVARNPGFGRNILAIREVRRAADGLVTVLELHVREKARVHAALPVDCRIHSQRVTGVEKPEHIVVRRGNPLQVEAAIDLGALVDVFGQPRLQSVLMTNANQRDLVVINCAAGEVWQRIVIQQETRLGADQAGRDYDAAADVAVALIHSWHKCLLRRGSAILRPLVTDEKHRAVPE
jgi:hypothetical protein